MADVTAERLATGQRRLPVGRTIADAYRAVGRNFRTYAIQVLLWSIIKIALGVLFVAVYDLLVEFGAVPVFFIFSNIASTIVALAILLIGASILSVSCHRAMLLNQATTIGSMVRFGRVQWRALQIWLLWLWPLAFFLALLASGAGAYLAALDRLRASEVAFAQYPLLRFYDVVLMTVGPFSLLWSVAMLAICILALPMLVVNQTGASLRRAWQLGRGKRLRLIAASCGALLPLILLYCLVIVLSWSVARHTAPDGSLIHLGPALLIACLQFGAVVVVSAVASAVYLRLAGPPPDAIYTVFDE